MKLKSKTWIVLLGAVVGFFAYFFNEDDKIIFGVSCYMFSWIYLSLSALVASFLIQSYMQWSASKTALLTYFGLILGVIAFKFYTIIAFNISPRIAPIVIIVIILDSIIVLSSAFLGAFSSKLIQYFKK